LANATSFRIGLELASDSGSALNRFAAAVDQLTIRPLELVKGRKAAPSSPGKTLDSGACGVAGASRRSLVSAIPGDVQHETAFGYGRYHWKNSRKVLNGGSSTRPVAERISSLGTTRPRSAYAIKNLRS
jgi:hypothetical protein